MDHPRADEAEWVVLMEGADAGAVGAAAPRATFKLASLKHFGVIGGADHRHLSAAVRQSALSTANDAPAMTQV